MAVTGGLSLVGLLLVGQSLVAQSLVGLSLEGQSLEGKYNHCVPELAKTRSNLLRLSPAHFLIIFCPLSRAAHLFV